MMGTSKVQYKIAQFRHNRISTALISVAGHGDDFTENTAKAELTSLVLNSEEWILVRFVDPSEEAFQKAISKI